MLMALVALLLVPIRAIAAAPPTGTLELARSHPAASLDDLDLEADLDGGACGDEEEQPEEFVHCGSELSVFDRPGLLGVLRESLERMTPGQCLELLDDLYERETCRVGGRECGDLLPQGLPPVAPKSLSNSSSSASAWLERLALIPAESKVVGPRASDDRMPRARAIAPPERPPRSLAHG